MQTPEIQRSPLTLTLLTLKQFGIALDSFDWIDPPARVDVAAAYVDLLKLDALRFDVAAHHESLMRELTGADDVASVERRMTCDARRWMTLRPTPIGMFRRRRRRY